MRDATACITVAIAVAVTTGAIAVAVVVAVAVAVTTGAVAVTTGVTAFAGATGAVIVATGASHSQYCAGCCARSGKRSRCELSKSVTPTRSHSSWDRAHAGSDMHKWHTGRRACSSEIAKKQCARNLLPYGNCTRDTELHRAGRLHEMATVALLGCVAAAVAAMQD